MFAMTASVLNLLPSLKVTSGRRVISNAVLPIPGKPGPLKADYFFAGTAAHDADDRIIYNKANGFVTFDSNGDLPGGTTLLAVLMTRPMLTARDFVVI